AAVAPQPSGPGVRPRQRQCCGRESEAEQHQRGPCGETDHHPHAVDLITPHAGDPDAEGQQGQREQGEQPPAIEPVLTCRHVSTPMILPSLRAERSNPYRRRKMDCFASLAMTRMHYVITSYICCA